VDLSAQLSLGASFTDVPGGIAFWTFDGGTNYNDDAGEVEIVISKAHADVNVTGHTLTYDGNAHGATGTATGVGDIDLSSSLSLGATFTDVPGGTAHWEFDGGTNYEDQEGDVQIVIEPATVTGAFTADNKVYDGNATATILTRSITGGLISPDVVTLEGGTANFNDKNVGNGKTVTAAGFTLGGADAGNYELGTVTTTTANITEKHITGSFTVADKEYDRTTAATVLTRSVSGAIAGDDVTLSGGTATFDTRNVGPAKVVTLTGATLSGADKNNYSLDSVATAVAAITAKPVTGSFQALNKPFDGNTDATIVAGSLELTGVITGDVVSMTGTTAHFASALVGTQVVTCDDCALGGADAGNYLLTTPVTTTASILAWSLTGFYEPVGVANTVLNLPAGSLPPSVTWNTIKGGQTVPLKFNLYATAGGAPITTVSSVQSITLASVPCGGGPEDALGEAASTGGTTLRWDGVQFIQNWASPKGAGKCYRVTMTADDGSSLSAFFKTK
jgi:hypothetical protein